MVDNEACVYLNDYGQPITAEEHYTRLIGIAQERQKAFPWWSASRRRWKAHERRYRAEMARRGLGS